MKRVINKIVFSLALVSVLTSCGKDFLNTDYNEGVDLEDALTTVPKVETAVTGAYYNLINYRFAGRDVIAMGDIASDLSNHNYATNHFTNIFNYNISETNIYLKEIWEYGYKAVSLSARIIEAGEKLLPTVSPVEKYTLNHSMAQAHGIRALAYHYMVNIFALPYKVDDTTNITTNNGINNGMQLGLPLVDKPIPAFSKVSRSTIEKTYQAINSDIDAAIRYFEGLDPKSYAPEAAYINTASMYAFRARVALAEQKYEDAIVAAKKAQELAENMFGKKELAYTTKEVVELYKTNQDNRENLFYIARSASEHFSANSIGTLYSNYGVRPNDAYVALLSDSDVRKVLPTYKGGKYMGIASGSSFNPAISSIPLFRLPELHLIIAESHLKKATPDIAEAKKALLVVASRDRAYVTDSNGDGTMNKVLPDAGEALFDSLKNERARELFWEGHRISDLKRWGKKVSVENGRRKYFEIWKFCYPIPADEVNSGFGVVQNPNWSNALPPAPTN